MPDDPVPTPTPDPGPTPDPTPDPTPQESWLDSLPEDLKSSPSLTRYKEPSALAKGYIELEKKLGSQVRAPKPDADPKEWDAYYKSLGRPDNPDQYEIAKPDDVPWSEESEKRLRHQAHKLGLTQRQTQGLVNAFAEDVKDSMKARREALGEAEKTLKEKYQANYPRNMAIAQRALKSVDSDGSLKAFLEDTGLGNHPAVIELFLNYGKRMVEDGLIAGDVDGIATKEMALQKIKAMESDPKHPYHSSKVGDAVHEEYRQLFQIAYD